MGEMDGFSCLKHLFVTMFLYNLSVFMVIPSIIDVTMTAICPGKDSCTQAILLTGVQQAVTGLGTLLVTPVIGELSDEYGRRALLTLPLTANIFPLAILAYNRNKLYFYIYYVFKTLSSIACEGNIVSLSLAYVADNVAESRRASAFGILSGIASSGFVIGTLTARLLSTTSTFQVSAAVALIAAIYMRFFLHDSFISSDESSAILTDKKSLTSDTVNRRFRYCRKILSLEDILHLMRNSCTFSKAATIVFFTSMGDYGLQTSLLYYLKAKFHFNKDQYSILLLIFGIAGVISQLFLMPIFAPRVGEERLLRIGLLAACGTVFLYAISWSFWVPYISSSFGVVSVFVSPCIRSIVSKQVGPNEQGKVQGCISGICSSASIISPMIFSPLTAMFLSENAPFHFPGFSILCIGLPTMIALIQSLVIRSEPSKSTLKSNNSGYNLA